MRTIFATLARLALLSTLFGALVTLAPSCGPGAPPEGFTLAIQCSHVNVAALDSIRITIAPVMVGTMTGHFLQPMHGTSFENGEINVSVDSVTGLLTIDISGTYARAHAMADAMGNDPRLEIQLWTDDHQMTSPPQLRATVTHNGMQVATGVVYLPSWPLVLGDSTQVNVPCMTGFDMQCAGM
jgi:hypothetical protein